MANFERQPANKIWISDLYSGKFIRSDDEFKPNFLVVNEKNISRLNLVVTVVNKYEKEGGNYISLVIDDSSAQTRVKCWGEDCKLLNNINKGDIILLIGKAKEDKISKEGYYVSAEIVKKVDPNFEVLRRLELIKEYGKCSEFIKKESFVKDEEVKTEEVEEIKISSSGLRNKILNSIEKNDNVDFESLLKDIKCPDSDLNYEINELIKDGEIFEVKGKYNLLR